MVERKELSVDRASVYFEKLREDMIQERKDHDKRLMEEMQDKRI